MAFGPDGAVGKIFLRQPDAQPAHRPVEAADQIVGDLSARGFLVYAGTTLHSYPHCWRTDTPLIYKAVSSWFVAATVRPSRPRRWLINSRESVVHLQV